MRNEVYDGIGNAIRGELVWLCLVNIVCRSLKANWRAIFALSLWLLSALGTGWWHIADRWLVGDHECCLRDHSETAAAGHCNCQAHCQHESPAAQRHPHDHKHRPAANLQGQCSLCVVFGRSVVPESIFIWRSTPSVLAATCFLPDTFQSVVHRAANARGPPLVG